MRMDSKWHALAAMAWLWYVFVFFRRKVASLLVNWGTCLYVSDYVLYPMRCLSCARSHLSLLTKILVASVGVTDSEAVDATGV